MTTLERFQSMLPSLVLAGGIGFLAHAICDLSERITALEQRPAENNGIIIKWPIITNEPCGGCEEEIK